MAFIFDEDYQADLERAPQGILRATAGEVFGSEMEALELGGMSTSEFQQVRDMLEEQVDRLNERDGTGFQVNERALRDHIMGGLDLQRDQVERGIPNAFFRRQVEDFDALQAFLAAAKARDPDHVRTLEEIRAEAAARARAAQDAADEVASRATGFDRFLGQAGAGVLRDIQEPVIVGAGVLTLPIAVEAFGASLFARGIGLAVTEGAAAGLGEFAVQENLRDFYRRQGFAEAEIDQRVLSNVAGSAAGAAVLAPGLYLGGVALKSLGSAFLEKLASRNPRLVLEAAEEAEAAGVQLTAGERADLDLVRQQLRFQDSLPPVLDRTPENLRLHEALTRGVLDALDRGEVRPEVRRVLETGAPGRLAEMQRAVAALERGKPISRRAVEKLLDKEAFADFKARLSTASRLAKGARQTPESNPQIRVVQAAEKARELTDGATTPAADLKAGKARKRAGDLFGKLTDAERAIFDVAEDGLPALKAADPVSRQDLTGKVALEVLTEAIDRRSDPAAPVRGIEVREMPAEARRLVAQGLEPGAARAQAELTGGARARAEEIANPDPTVQQLADGELDEALHQRALQQLDEDLAADGGLFAREDLEAHKADFDEILDDEEALEALAQCALSNAA